MRDNRNLVLFMIGSLLIMMGWSYLSITFRPRPTAPTVLEPAPDLLAKLPPVERAPAVARIALAAVPGGQGFDPATRLATELAVLANPPPKIDPWPWSRRRPEVQQAVVAQLASLAPFGGLEDAVRIAATLGYLNQSPPVPTRAVVPEQTLTLGNDTDYFLKIELTSRGAAVRRVILNRFQAADGYGLPVWQDPEKRQKTPLELVPPHRVKQRTELTDPKQAIEYDPIEPFHHYQMLHYASPDDDRPVDTLSKELWDVEKVPSPSSDVQEAVFGRTIEDARGLPIFRITKTYTLKRGEYHIGLSVKVKNLREEESRFRYQLSGARGLPIEGEWYTYTFRNSLIGRVDKGGYLWRDLQDGRTIAHKEGGERSERQDGRIQYAGIAVQFFAAVIVVDDDQSNKNFLESARPTMEAAAWVGKIIQVDPGSFSLRVDDNNEPYQFHVGNPEVHADVRLAHQLGRPVAVIYSIVGDRRVAVRLLPPSRAIPRLLDDITVRVMTEILVFQAGGETEHRYLLYHGPVKPRLLHYFKGSDTVDEKLVDRYEDTLHLATLTDYPSAGPFGWIGKHTGLTWLIIQFTNLMHAILDRLHAYVFPWSYGVCILFLTAIVRGVIFPISRRQTRNMREMSEKMQKVKPELDKLKQKYQSDPMELMRAQQELFRKHGINPLASMGGCLMIFAQMPIFMGLYYCLQESVHFRLQPLFSWIPWIPNLAAPDMLLWWSERIWWISEPASQDSFLFLGPYLNVLPVIAVALMLVHQQMMTPPAMDEQQEMQMKMMKWMMIVFGVMFYKVAAGLCIYFIASSLWGLAERKLISKPPDHFGDRPEPPLTPAAKSRPESKPRSEPGKDGDGFFQKMGDWWQEVLKEAEKQKQARRDPPSGEPRKKKRRDDESNRRKKRE